MLYLPLPQAAPLLSFSAPDTSRLCLCVIWRLLPRGSFLAVLDYCHVRAMDGKLQHSSDVIDEASHRGQHSMTIDLAALPSKYVPHTTAWPPILTIA